MQKPESPASRGPCSSALTPDSEVPPPPHTLGSGGAVGRYLVPRPSWSSSGPALVPAPF